MQRSAGDVLHVILPHWTTRFCIADGLLGGGRVRQETQMRPRSAQKPVSNAHLAHLRLRCTSVQVAMT